MVINGTDLHLFIGADAAEKHVGHAKSHTIDMGTGEIDISNKDTGGWDDFLAGRKNWTASCDAMFDMEDAQGFEQAFDAWLAGTPVRLVSAIKTGANAIDTGAMQLVGTAIITSISLSSGDGEAVTYSVSYKGKGALAKVAAIP
ncbi:MULTISPECIES: phage tail tube protein [unclassified Carboxylicivirga]|uniref:phage tail tube protein n=1 Tax=Carboxylicivirga TaxID=1628153 RepID=UPI003D32A9CF